MDTGQTTTMSIKVYILCLTRQITHDAQSLPDFVSLLRSPQSNLQKRSTKSGND